MPSRCPQHTKPSHNGYWTSHSKFMMPMSTKQKSKYSELLPLESLKGIPRSWLSWSLFRTTGAQKLGLEKTLGGCLVQHQSQDSIRYAYTAPDMCLSNLFFKTLPLMDFHHSFV